MIEYDFYKMVYGGSSISEGDWNWYASRAVISFPDTSAYTR